MNLLLLTSIWINIKNVLSIRVTKASINLEFFLMKVILSSNRSFKKYNFKYYKYYKNIY